MIIVIFHFLKVLFKILVPLKTHYPELSNEHYWFEKSSFYYKILNQRNNDVERNQYQLNKIIITAA